MKSLVFLLITACIFTSCATRKYGCNSFVKDKIYRSNGEVVVIDSDLVVIRLNGMVISENYDMVSGRFIMAKGDFCKYLRSFNHKFIKFEFTRPYFENKEIIYTTTGCVEEIEKTLTNVGNNTDRSKS